MRNNMNMGMELRIGVSVMPETILFVGGEVTHHLAKELELDAANAADLGYRFMIYLKENLLIITKQISDMYSQASTNLDITKAHDLAFEYLLDAAAELFDLKPKKSEWEMIKEQEATSESMAAIITAIETANEKELAALFLVYPDLVLAFLNK